MANDQSNLSDFLKNQNILFIVGVMSGRGKASKEPFGMVSALVPRTAPGLGWEGQTVFCDPELLTGYAGPGLYEVAWTVQLRQGAGAARLAGMKLAKAFQFVI